MTSIAREQMSESKTKRMDIEPDGETVFQFLGVSKEFLIGYVTTLSLPSLRMRRLDVSTPGESNLR
jgi:hypothetical protein